ncbi:unnamed protein product, partial [Mesorhabditis spiculigera]
MLTLLLFLVLNHSVMVAGADSDDDPDFDLRYAILLGGLFVLLVYQLIPRRQRKISYEEQADFEKQFDDPALPNGARAIKGFLKYRREEHLKADEDPDREILKTTPREYSEALLSMILLMAINKSSLKHYYPASVLQLVFDEDTWTLKTGIAKKAVTMDLLKRLCRRVARSFAATLNMSISAFLFKRINYWSPVGLHGKPVPGETSDEQLGTLVAVQLFSETGVSAGIFGQDLCAWLRALDAEDDSDRECPKVIEQYMESLAEEVIDKLAEACSDPDRFGPDGPTHANREIVKAFREGTPEGLHGEPVPGETSDEQLRTLIAVQLFERAADPTAALERDVYAWLHALESEDGGTMARPEDIEQYLVSLAEEVIDKLAEACSGPDRFGPDGPTHANREIVKAFRGRVRRDLGC